MKSKNYLRYIFSAAIIILLVFSCITVSGCNFSPTEIEKWYIRDIIENGKSYSSGMEDYYNGILLSSDYMTFAFKTDGTVTVTYISGDEQSGTFIENKKSKDTDITVNLQDGTVFTGSCGKYMFDGVWYEFSLTDGKTEYILTDSNHSPKESQTGVILKNIYPEIASLTVSGIREIICSSKEADMEIAITEAQDKENFLNSFSIASFLSEHSYGGFNEKPSVLNYYATSLTVKTDNAEYIIPLCVYKNFERVYILYNSEYYELRDDFAEWLLSLFTAQQAQQHTPATAKNGTGI